MNRAAAMLAVLCVSALILKPAGAKPSTHTPQPGQIDPAVVRAELENILSHPEYNRSYAKKTEGIGHAIGEAIRRALAWLVDFLRPDAAKGIGKITAAVLAWLIVIAFVILLAAVLIRLAANPRASVRGGRTAAPQTRFDLPAAEPLINRAAMLADKGDYREAFRCAYLASIARLDEHKTLRFEPSRTNWEYIRELETQGHEYPRGLLEPLTADFDRVFYGGDDCPMAEYAAAAAAYEAIGSYGGAR